MRKQGLTLDQLIRYCGASSTLSATARTRMVAAICNDSRKVAKGDVFVAIATDTNDGHNFVETAISQGGAVAIVAKSKVKAIPENLRDKLIIVSDPVTALQTAAAKYRNTLSATFVGITGSNGKTTTRTFVSAVLRQKLTVGETKGNFNNHIGVPLSLLAFTGVEQAAVLEMGANHHGEIHALSSIVRPEIGMITNIGYAHIGYFGSQAKIADAKFEITDGMKTSGVLLLNGDDPILVRRAKSRKQRIVFFGTSAKCGIRATDISQTKSGTTTFIENDYRFAIPMPGRHFVYSALAAIAVAREFGIDNAAIAHALAALEPVSMRGAIQKKRGVTFIVDCYNANPSSMKSGIELLTDVASGKPSAAIVGDMRELGRYANRLHVILGTQLGKAGIRKVLAVGEYADKIAKGARDAGITSRNILTAANSTEAVASAKQLLVKGDTVLLKGSRGVHLETVFEGY